MKTGSSSLLRPSPAPLAGVTLLGILALAFAPLATAASPAPDPSPHVALAQPDPFPLPRAPTQPAMPVLVRTVPVYVQRPSVRVQTPAATVAPKQARKAPATRHKPQKSVVRTTHSASELVALAYSTVDSPQHVSRTLVLVLGLLVVLSASLVAGAARELTR
jgi:hypothetical protein